VFQLHMFGNLHVLLVNAPAKTPCAEAV